MKITTLAIVATIVLLGVGMAYSGAHAAEADDQATVAASERVVADCESQAARTQAGTFRTVDLQACINEASLREPALRVTPIFYGPDEIPEPGTGSIY